MFRRCCGHPISLRGFRSAAARLIIPLTFASRTGLTVAAVLHVQPGGNDASNGADWAQANKTVGAALNAAKTADLRASKPLWTSGIRIRTDRCSTAARMEW
jgi:hypothetical protein